MPQPRARNFRTINNQNNAVVESYSSLVETARLESNLIVTKTNVLLIESQVAYTYTVQDLLRGHIVRRLLDGTTANRSDTFPSASAFKDAGFKKGDMFEVLIDTHNETVTPGTFTLFLNPGTGGINKSDTLTTASGYWLHRFIFIDNDGAYFNYRNTFGRYDATKQKTY
jgi:hypothetical protein